MTGSPTLDASNRVVDGAKRRVLSVAGFGVTGLGFAVLHHQVGVGVPCPFLALTGWWCPFCGATRMASAVLDGEWGVAFHWNPVVFIGLLVLAVATSGWVVEWATRRPPPWRGLSQRLSFTQWFTIAAVLLVVWTLVRNIARILVGG